MRKLLTGQELNEQLSVIPDYRESIRTESKETRLLALDQLHQIFVANDMTKQIYTKLYLAVQHSIRKKKMDGQKQIYENFKALRQNTAARGLAGGADSFSILGSSGIGKTTAVQRSIELIGAQEDFIPVLQVQCPNDCNVRGLLVEILRCVDLILSTQYYERTVKTRPTIDMLVSAVSNVLIKYCGVLVIDEIQNVRNNIVRSNSGSKFIAFLTQLINQTGISIVVVGTPESRQVFEMEMYLARRTIGLEYKPMPYGKEFCQLCEIIWKYQYTKEAVPYGQEISQWLYQHTGGLPALTVSLIRDAQEMAILGSDYLNLEVMQNVYRQQYMMMERFRSVQPTRQKTSKTVKRNESGKPITKQPKDCFARLQLQCKKTGEDMVEKIKPLLPVWEVAVSDNTL